MKPIYRIHLNPSTALQVQKKAKAVRLHETDKVGEFFVSDYSYNNIQAGKIPHEVIQTYQEKNLPVRIVYPSRSYLFEPPHAEAVEEITTYAMSQRKNEKSIQVLYMGRRTEPQEESIILDRPGGKRSYQWRISSKPQPVKDIRDGFPKIKAAIQDPDTKVILSFGSGGVRLFAHTALMKFINLLELRPFIDEIWGSSGGAIAGLPYAVGVEPEVIEQEGYHIYNERYSFRFSPSKLDVVKNLISDAFLPPSDHMLKGFLDVQQALEELLKKHIADRERRIPFYCIAYNLKERRNEVLTPEDVDSSAYMTPILHTDALDAVIASSAIPILYVPKRILRGKTEHLYIDGGTTEEVPLISPYRKWVRDCTNKKETRKKLLIFSVNLFPQAGASRLFTHWIFKKIPAFRLLQLSATYADLVRQARIDEHKGTLKRNKDVIQWELVLPMPGAGIVNTKVIPRVIETAQYSFFDQLVRLEKSL
jgi:predicted acylesterase/phospholipase RssA